MKVHTAESQAKMTPDSALEALIEGNNRFVTNVSKNRNLIEQVKDTAIGQYPFATILHCIDSRISAEFVFDQGIGDVFAITIAGNFVNEDILGSMEFGCKLAGTKLVLVLGHTSCGAIKGACDHARLGNLTSLIQKIEPAVAAVKEPSDKSLRTSENIDFVNAVAKQNVFMTLDNIRAKSEILKSLEDDGTIKIVGGMYDVASGIVEIL